MSGEEELIPFDLGPDCQLSGEPFRNLIPRLPPDHPARIAAVDIRALMDPVIKEWAMASQVFGPDYRAGGKWGVVGDEKFVLAVPQKPPEGSCRVYWGSHGCDLPRGHSADIPHACDCCECENHPDPDPGNPGSEPSCVARPPYYGPDTRFFGEDAEAYGLPR